MNGLTCACACGGAGIPVRTAVGLCICCRVSPPVSAAASSFPRCCSSARWPVPCVAVCFAAAIACAAAGPDGLCCPVNAATAPPAADLLTPAPCCCPSGAFWALAFMCRGCCCPLEAVRPCGRGCCCGAGRCCGWGCCLFSFPGLFAVNLLGACADLAMAAAAGWPFGAGAGFLPPVGAADLPAAAAAADLPLASDAAGLLPTADLPPPAVANGLLATAGAPDLPDAADAADLPLG